MERFVLTDAQWAKMEPHCLGKPTDPGRSGKDNRLFVEAVLWVVRTGSRWRDLPAFFAKWNTVFKRYRDWVEADVFVRLFEACSDQPDMEYAMIDATIVKVHRTARAQKGDSKPGHRPFQRRHDHQNSGADRRARLPRALRSVARPSLRYGRCCAPPRRHRSRCADRRQSLRQQRHSRRLERPRRQDRHFRASSPSPKTPVRCRDVQMASSDRELLLQAQG